MAGPSLIATLGANISPFVRDLGQAKAQAKQHGEGIGSAFGDEIGGKLKGLLSAAAIEETIRRTVEYGSKVNDLALRLGISTDAVQQWDHALKQNGSSIDAATGFFEKLAIARDKVMAGGEKGAELESQFAKLGISIGQLKNSRIEDIGASISKAFEAGDPQALIGALRAVGGKSAGELVTAFRGGLTGLLADAPLIKAEDIAELDAIGDSFDSLKTRILASSGSMIVGIKHGFEILAGAVGGFGIAIGESVEKKFDSSSFSGFVKSFGAAMAAPFTGAWKGAGDAVEVMDERDKDARELFAKKQSAAAAAKSEKEMAVLNKKTREAEDTLAEKRAAEANQVLAIHEQIAEARRKSALAGMTDEEKKVALADQIAAKQKEIQQMKDYGGATDLEIAKEEKNLSGLEGELAGVNRRKDKPDFEVNSLQRIGGIIGTFSSVTQLAAVDYAQKSESHLQKIEKHLAKITVQRVGEDVAF